MVSTASAREEPAAPVLDQVDRRLLTQPPQDRIGVGQEGRRREKRVEIRRLTCRRGGLPFGDRRLQPRLACRPARAAAQRGTSRMPSVTTYRSDTLRVWVQMAPGSQSGRICPVGTSR